MRDSIYRFTLDVHDISSQVQIVAKKNDNARKIYVTLMEYGKPYMVEDGCQAVMMIKKPDGNVLFNDCYFINTGSVIAYDFTVQTTAISGLCECEIRVYNMDHELITSPRFTILVNETVYDDGQISSTSEFSTLNNALANIAEIREGIQRVDADTVIVLETKDEVVALRNETEAFRNETSDFKDETEAIKNIAVTAGSEASTSAQSASTSAQAAGISATNAENAKQYIIDHRDELKGDKGDSGVDRGTELPTDLTGIDVFILENGEDDELITRPEFNALANEVSNNEAKILKNTKDIELLFKVNRGITWDFENKEESGMNIAPSGALNESVLEVRGKTEQETLNGYQQLEPFSTSGSRDTVNFALDKNVITVKGTSNATTKHYVYLNSGNVFSGNLNSIFLKAGTYTFSVDNVPNGLDIGLRKDVASIVKALDGNSLTATFTIDEDTYCGICIGYSENVPYDATIKVQIESGSVAHEWEEFCGGIPSPNPQYPQEVVGVEELNVSVGGRNRCNVANLGPFYKNKTVYGVTFTVDEEAQTITLNGKATANCFAKVELLPTEKFNSKGATIQLINDAWDSKGIENIGVRLDNGVNVSPVALFSNANSKYVIPNYYDFEVTLIGLRITTGCEFDNYTFKICVVPSGVDSTYEPYIEPTTRKIIPPLPLHKIGDYADRLDVVDGVWKIATKSVVVNKVVVLGTSNGFTRFNTSPYTDALISLVRKPIYSDKFKYVASGDSLYECFIYNQRIFITIDQSITTISEANTWLEQEHPYFIYPSAEEETTPIDSADLEWLRAFDGMSADKVITITDQNGNDVSYLVEYFVDLKKALAASEGE